MDWIIDNKEWIFSGAGIFLIGLILRLIIKKGGSNFSIKSGNNCNNIQVNSKEK
jgi:hypothetical protein